MKYKKPIIGFLVFPLKGLSFMRKTLYIVLFSAVLLQPATLHAEQNRHFIGPSHQILVEKAESSKKNQSQPAVETSVNKKTVVEKKKELPPQDKKLKLTLNEAISIGVKFNPSIQIEQLVPESHSQNVEREKAVFDRSWSVEAADSITRRDQNATPASVAVDSRTSSQEVAGATTRTRQDGTKESIRLTTDKGRSGGQEEKYTFRLGADYTIPLLRGQGRAVNLVSLRQSENTLARSLHELNGFTQNLIYQIETTYYELYLAEEQISVYEKSLRVSKQALKERQERVNVGQLAQTELAFADAEVAKRQEALINARASWKSKKLEFIRLLGLHQTGWDRNITLKKPASIKQKNIKDIDPLVLTAMDSRPELKEMELQIASGKLQLIETRNGLLPRLDLFLRLGKSGYSDSFSESLKEIGSGSFDFQSGLTWSLEENLRSARATHRRAEIALESTKLSRCNLESTIQLDVRKAAIELERAMAQQKATSRTLSYQQQVYDVEKEKYEVGQGTAYLVSQASRDLLQSQISVLEARVSLLKAQLTLEFSQGLLLEKYQITLSEVRK
jgi:outer membrane protein TolC